MYKTHVPIIRAMAENLDSTEAIFAFVMATIRRPFYEVDPSNVLTKHQREGMQYVKDNRHFMRSTLLRDDWSIEEKIEVLLAIKGMNIPKVSFVLQLTGHEIGCIDTHNCVRLGMKAEDLMQRKDRPLNREKIWRYIGLCQSREMGGSERMWNNWCHHIANLYPHKFEDTYMVSRHHVRMVDEFYYAIHKGTI